MKANDFLISRIRNSAVAQISVSYERAPGRHCCTTVFADFFCALFLLFLCCVCGGGWQEVEVAVEEAEGRPVRLTILRQLEEQDVTVREGTGERERERGD